MGEELKVIPLSEIKNLKIHGRTTGNLSPLTLFWTGSALEFNVRGTELWLEIESSYASLEPWCCTVINSSPVSRQMLTKGRYWICIFRGMNVNEIKNVKFLKESQAMNSDQECCLQIHAVKTDGEFLAVDEKPVKIEFIGDSITSGEGCVGSKFEEDWLPMWFSAYHNYTRLTAEALNADYRIISQSGWGVYTGWDNNPHTNIPEYYEKVCGILTGKKNRELGAQEENNFTVWQPDVIVVNLGTNDGAAFDNPAWLEELRGEFRKQHTEEDGSFRIEDIKAYEAAEKAFLTKLRKHNPKALIIWVYGMLGLTMLPAIRRAAEEYMRSAGDDRVFVLELPDTTEEEMGARRHPGLSAHEKAAEVLSRYIKNRIGNA